MNKSFVGLVLAAGSIFALALGIRSAQPLFISSINSATGIGYATISLAFAVAQIVWGIAQPVAGGIGDRWGPRPVMLAGAVFLALGTALTAMAQTPLALTLAIGVVAAAGAGAFGPAQLASAVSKWIPEAKRSVANGIIGAGGSFGQFVIVPLAQLSQLSQMVSQLSIQMETAVKEFGERAAMAVQSASSPLDGNGAGVA